MSSSLTFLLPAPAGGGHADETNVVEPFDKTGHAAAAPAICRDTSADKRSRYTLGGGSDIGGGDSGTVTGFTARSSSSSSLCSRPQISQERRSLDAIGKIPSDLDLEQLAQFSFRNEGSHSEYSSRLIECARDREKQRRIKNIFSMATLKFGTLALHGRDDEIALLKECFNRLVPVPEAPLKGSSSHGDCRYQGSRELVLISGASGTGKSRLAVALKDSVEKEDGVYITGKFDFHLQGEPYAGIAAACQELCGIILDNLERDGSQNEASHSLFLAFQDAILKELADEIHLLISLVPDLAAIMDGQDLPIGERDPCGQKAVSYDLDNHQAKSRFNYAFCSFIKVICYHFSPVVMVLDDLQWADSSSLELLEELVSDNEISGLMVIGSYRSDEVDETHVLSIAIHDLRRRGKREDIAKSRGDSFNMTEISLGNLSVHNVNQLLMALMSMDEEVNPRTWELAELCHKRTLGNVFYLNTYIAMLHEKHLIQFDMLTFSWTWDVSVITHKTAASANVVDILREKIDELCPDGIQLLQIAACLGSSFNLWAIELTWNAFWEDLKNGFGVAVSKKNIETKSASLPDLLSQVVQENFLERVGMSADYRWVHDKVQEAVMSMIGPDQLALMNFKVGETLLLSLPPQELNSAIFVVCNLLNNGDANFQSDVKRMEIAELNLQAAEKAMGLSAFESSGKYAKNGIELLPHNCWENFHCASLSLQLFSVGAEAEAATGNTDQAHVYCEEVLQQKGVDVFGKLRVFHVLIGILGNGGRPKEALELCLNVLGQLGCKFPKTKAGRACGAVISLMKTKSYQNSVRLKEMPTCFLMQDPAKLECMKLLHKAGLFSLYCKDDLIFVLVHCRVVRRTLRYGLSDYAPPGMAGFGLLLEAMGDYDAATKYADFALEMLGKSKRKHMESKTLMFVHGMIRPWTKPIQNSIPSLMQGYKIGMQAGDTESGMWSLFFSTALTLLSGKPLAMVAEDCASYIPQMATLKQKEQGDLTVVMHQAVLNLMACSSDPLKLTGEAMDEQAFFDKAKSSQSGTLTIFLHFFQSYLCAYLGEHELGARLALKKGDEYLKSAPGDPIVMADTFCRAISLYAMARKTKSRKFRIEATRVRAIIKKWREKGNPNVNHHVLLLDAEHAALNGQRNVARVHFRQAAKFAGRCGFVPDAALINERFALFLAEMQDEDEEARFRMNAAVQLYTEWGAHRAVSNLYAKHPNMFPIPTEIRKEVRAPFE